MTYRSGKPTFQGSATKYELKIANCPVPYTFVLIVEFRKFSDGAPMGVITAFQESI